MFDLEFPYPWQSSIAGSTTTYRATLPPGVYPWGPVLSCLYYDPRPLRLGRSRYSPLRQFEFEFHKVYTAQRLWKVPDPELRARLRKAIAKKITSGYAKFLEDNQPCNHQPKSDSSGAGSDAARTFRRIDRLSSEKK
ncbi:hypothetical protein C2845_PM09G24990 [Panicum miliaceum]|uniref:Exocyst subunit Exo70 family protein n=1 Tax=Panicum miliaceum TaxID=4540 RepID=A0A3L6S1H1_PANMI|nr:hypothetical protein C2845_PM09G24990 [Panicum miliaceum]